MIDLSFAEEIVKFLGGFPLALSNAAAYIASKKIDFKTYYERITGDARFLDTVGNISKQVGLEYRNSNTVFTWILSHDALSCNASRVLTMCGFLSNDDIPMKLLKGGDYEPVFREDWLSHGT